MLDFSNRTVLVIGASSGIGRQTAITLSEMGARVVLVSRNEEKLNAVRNELAGEGHTVYSADVSQVDTIAPLFRKIVSECGALDGMVYSAGVGSSVPFTQAKPEKVQEVFNVNFFGFYESVRQACRKGRYNEGMKIVGLSSIASLCGDKAKSIYSATKGAMDAAVRCMAKEAADRGICINTVAPSMTATVLYDNYLERYGEDSESNRALLSRQYLGIADPQDVANVIAFLLSPASKFMTGTTVPVDGGYTSC